VAAVIGGDVHAFEPGREAIEELELNCRLNGAEINIHEFALGDKNTEMSLQITGRTGNRALIQNHDTRGEMVPVRRGEDIDAPNSDILKIDVEGAEKIVLEGLGDMLDDVRICYVELHDGENELAPKSQTIESKMKDLGFEVEDVNSGKDIIKCISPCV